MYQDPKCIQGSMSDQTYILQEPIKALCCPCVLSSGSILRVCKYTSKNRLLVRHENGNGYHKVKRSNLNRAGILYFGGQS